MRNKLQYYYVTTKHKIDVLYYMSIFCLKLMKRALIHDLSKYSKQETEGFAKLTRIFMNTEYGSKEYNDIMSKEEKTVNLHRKRNRHHPEYYEDVNNMTIYDLIEMIIDWRAATKKNINGDINKSFAINKERFNFSDNILNLLRTL